MNEEICRFCLKIVCDNDFEIVEEITREILDKLLLKLDLDVLQKPLMCNECANNLQKSLDFKSMCICTEDKILFCVDSGASVGLDLKEVYLRENENASLIDFSDDWKICRFCLRLAEGGHFSYLNETKENMFILDMLQRHIPESNFMVNEELVACRPCLCSAQHFFQFVTNCLDVEKKIKKYIEIEGTNEKGLIELKNVHKFTLKPIVKCEITSNDINGTHVEKNYYEIVEKVKCEPKNETHIEVGNFCLDIKKEEIKVTSENYSESFQDIISTPKSPKIEDMNVEILIGESPSEPLDVQTSNNAINMDVFNCEHCTYTTNYKTQLLAHILVVHKNVFKCIICPFKTEYKRSLKQHMLTHKVLSETTVHACEKCPYKTKYKHNLNEHMLVHKDPSDIRMFKCGLCSYEAKRKNNLVKHMVMHKSPMEISMYKCTLCTYEAKFKSDLKNHMISHKDISEVTMFKCETCTFETKYKGYLKKHMRTHQTQIDFKMYTCDECEFQTRHRNSLCQHKLTHRDASEVTVFICKECSFKTKYKKVLGQHMLIHKDPSEIKMYKCEECQFATKRSNYLKLHALTHQSPSDIKMHKCEMCTYQTTRKIYLKRHKLTHKNIT